MFTQADPDIFQCVNCGDITTRSPYQLTEDICDSCSLEFTRDEDKDASFQTRY